MAPKIGRVASGSINFQLVAKEFKIKKGHSKITLAAIPSEPFFKHGAELVARLRGNKKTFTVRSGLKKVLKKIDWHESKLKPLKNLLKDLLDSGKKHPEKLLDLLSAFLKRSCRTNFSISFSPEQKDTTPETPHLQLCPDQEIDSLHFQIIPHHIKAKDGHVKVRLAAILAHAGFSKKAKVLATISHNKKSFSYSTKLKDALESINWTIDDLHPLKSFLKDTLKSSHHDPEIAVGLLSTFLKSGITPSIVVNKGVDSLRPVC